MLYAGWRREEGKKQAGLLLRCDLSCERIPMRLIEFCVKRESLLPLVKLLRQTGICYRLLNCCGKLESAASCNTIVGNRNLLLSAILLRQTGAVSSWKTFAENRDWRFLAILLRQTEVCCLLQDFLYQTGDSAI